MRILNRSPETDGMLWWRTAAEPQTDVGPVRFSMQPFADDWQEVVVHVDDRWSGTIDSLRIQPYMHAIAGDVYIDTIAITTGPPRQLPERPVIDAPSVVPQVSLPGIAQPEFRDAFTVLDECLYVTAPIMGFPVPVMGPGGVYGENWWQLDSSLVLEGAKWANQAFAESVIRGFSEVQDQNPDGRIDLWGGAPQRGQPGDVSSIPRYFEVAYVVAQRTDDADFRQMAYASMRDYLDWWLSSAKQDEETGLIISVAEETFAEPLLSPSGIMAAVDTNVAVALGCRNVSRLAQQLGHEEDAKKYAGAFDALANAINTHMWDEEAGYYCNYNLHEGTRRVRLLSSAMDPLRLGIVPPERQERLLELLLDPTYFNWGHRPVTSIARTEPDYVEAEGPYDGRAWFGDIWTMRNMPIIDGLATIGRHDLAAELAWSTVQTFNANYTEYVVPTTGSGEGVQRYGWSASQYIQSVVEYLFGVDYDEAQGRLRIFPRVAEELRGQAIALKQLILPTDPVTRLNVTVNLDAEGRGTVEAVTDRPLGMPVEIVLPANPDSPPEAADAEGNALEAEEAAGVKGAVAWRPKGEKRWTVRIAGT
jgi:hypothetical protein